MSVYRTVSVILILGGLFLIGNAILPIVTYELFTAPRFERRGGELLSPLADQKRWRGRSVDLTRASNWFVGLDSLSASPVSNDVRYYNLSIPKLKIENARVEIGGEDLSRNLIHYKGTAVPGKVGNAVIFGHSVLPQFFNPKNYLTIFSTLPTLKRGDEILVEYDGITYRFVVREMFEVEPTDLQVLDQSIDRLQLTLITCVPPGTYLRRLVVKADLVPPNTL